jgi:hypothetical protein
MTDNHDARADAVERLTSMLERDLLAIEEYQPLVERVLATQTSHELDAVMATVPAVDRGETLVLECRSGVVKEAPGRLPATTEVRCESGVMKIDLTRAEIDAPVADLEIEVTTGVLVVTIPRDMPVEVGDHVHGGGVFKNRLRSVRAEPGEPYLVVHVHNDTGVVKLRHPNWLERVLGRG